MARTTYVYDAETGKLVEKHLRRERPKAAAVHGEMESFISPIDGTLIDDRAKLRDHKFKHGVTPLQDYGENDGKAYFERHANERADRHHGRTKEQIKERKQDLYDSIQRNGG